MGLMWKRMRSPVRDFIGMSIIVLGPPMLFASGVYGIIYLLIRYSEVVLTSPYSYPAFIVLGLALYILKQKVTFYYGLFELIAALAAIYLSTNSTISTLYTRWFSVLTGIYIFVRGLDNMGKDIPDKLLPYWEAITAKTTSSIKFYTITLVFAVIAIIYFGFVTPSILNTAIAPH
jgi:hypothetical protein